jgi:hypothetical protein
MSAPSVDALSSSCVKKRPIKPRLRALLAASSVALAGCPVVPGGFFCGNACSRCVDNCHVCTSQGIDDKAVVKCCEFPQPESGVADCHALTIPSGTTTCCPSGAGGYTGPVGTSGTTGTTGTTGR